MNFKFDEKLIQLVKKNKLLYDTKAPFHRDLRRKVYAWENIAKELDSNVATCKKRWKGLRDTYVRHCKLMQKSLMRGEKYDLRWKHFNSMSFMAKIGRSGHGLAIDKDLLSECETDNFSAEDNQKFYDIFIESVLPNKDTNKRKTEFEYTSENLEFGDCNPLQEYYEQLENDNDFEEETNLPFKGEDTTQKLDEENQNNERISNNSLKLESESEKSFSKMNYQSFQNSESSSNQLFFTVIARKVDTLPIEAQEDLQTEIWNMVRTACRNARREKDARNTF